MADKDAYARACIGLYSRLWDALEQLCAPDALRGVRSEIIRLEIHLVLQSCETWRWRLLLTAAQRLTMQETLRELLHCLGADGTEISATAAAAAQNRLLDGVLDHCSMFGHAARRAPAMRILLPSAAMSDPMLHERDEAASDAQSGHGPWTGRQAARGGQDLR